MVRLARTGRAVGTALKVREVALDVANALTAYARSQTLQSLFARPLRIHRHNANWCKHTFENAFMTFKPLQYISER
jgi:hypothetical protein